MSETDHNTWLLCNTETGQITEWDPQFYEAFVPEDVPHPKLSALITAALGDYMHGIPEGGEDHMEDAYGYSMSDLLFGGNW